jgi:hypothetical protein
MMMSNSGFKFAANVLTTTGLSQFMDRVEQAAARRKDDI